MLLIRIKALKTVPPFRCRPLERRRDGSLARRGALREDEDQRTQRRRALRQGLAQAVGRQHRVQVRLVLHRQLGRRRHDPLLLHPLRSGRRLHQERQGEGGSHEHAVPHAG